MQCGARVPVSGRTQVIHQRSLLADCVFLSPSITNYRMLTAYTPRKTCFPFLCPWRLEPWFTMVRAPQAAALVSSSFSPIPGCLTTAPCSRAVRQREPIWGEVLPTPKLLFLFNIGHLPWSCSWQRGAEKSHV